MPVQVDVPQITTAQVEEITGGPFELTAHQCHAVSHAIVQSGVISGARVARGTCAGVVGQHSWVVVGTNPYQYGTPIIDVTLWSYDLSVTGVWSGRYVLAGRHRAHGDGWVFHAPFPESRGGEPIVLRPTVPLSRSAREFLDDVGPLDAYGWMMVANLPVRGWAAAEIVAAMHDTPDLRGFVPIDRVGMLTDRNPGGLYLPTGK